MSPERVFQYLSALGLLAGAWLYGDYWKKVGASNGLEGGSTALRAQNSELTLQIDELKGELAQVRSMLEKGPFPIPDDLISYVEKDLGMVFLKAPSAKRASQATLRNAAEKGIYLVRGENGLILENIAWELLDLIPSDQNLLGQWIAIDTEETRGLFDITSGEILLSETFDPQSIPDSAILVRLLAQQLAYQNHPQKEWTSRDEWQAWQATYLGAAESTRQRYQRSRSATEGGVTWKDPEQARNDLLLQLSPSMQGFANFPYLDGQDYAGHFYIDSRKAYLKMFREPAKTSAAIIHPDQLPINPVEISFKKTASLVMGQDSLGELGLRIWLEPYIGTQPASDLARNWRGDAYQLLDEKQKPILIWQIEMATIESAELLVEEARKSRIPPMREGQAERQLTISSQGTRVTFTNSPLTQ
ncbi:hypothetical protein N9A94_08975 [Akkermansiaceae bacterium]|nr:hypothetical protein [Akkermansiaceae bacterium]MDB4538099.1 hypothetical protein [Akkermansiaceae bacterium]